MLLSELYVTERFLKMNKFFFRNPRVADKEQRKGNMRMEDNTLVFTVTKAVFLKRPLELERR